MLYKAFMSYSHAADGELAPALQSALHRFAKSWYRLRAMRVFRDKTSLSATPELWPTIEKAMSESEYFLLLASPQAAASRWVQQEVDWWLEHRSVDKLFILVTDGELIWDRPTGDFDWTKTTALPRDLVASAISQLPIDPELSVLLAMEAVRVVPTDQAEDALRQSLVESHVRGRLRGHT